MKSVHSSSHSSLSRRFGSWGHDVMLCRDGDELERCLAAIRDRSWFRRHGVLIQELVPPLGYDLRVIVAGERVVGAVRRVAAPGEWRTNEALGGRSVQAQPSEEDGALAVSAARAVGADLLGVDLLPVPHGGYVVLQVNAAVDFDTKNHFPAEACTPTPLTRSRSAGIAHARILRSLQCLREPVVEQRISAPRDATTPLCASRDFSAAPSVDATPDSASEATRSQPRSSSQREHPGRLPETRTARNRGRWH